MKSRNVLPHDWYPAPMPANVELGDGAWLYSSFAFVHCRSRHPAAVQIGKSSGVYNGSFFELGPDGTVDIGSYCTLVGVIIVSNGRVRIGDYCFLAHEVVIADEPVAAPPHCAHGNRIATARSDDCVTLGSDVWVGTGAVLLSGAKIGNGAIVGAASVVDFEVPAFGVVGGNPGKILGFARPRDPRQDGQRP